MRENIFLHWIYPFQTISSIFGFCGRKAPPPRMMENLFTLGLSISDNFQQLWFLWQKSPPPPRMREIFLHLIYPFQTISSNFGFIGRKPPPPWMRENVFTLDLSISGNFQQLWFYWQKSLPPFRPFHQGQNYRTQDHGAYERPIGSPTTIHINIPAITVTFTY